MKCYYCGHLRPTKFFLLCDSCRNNPQLEVEDGLNPFVMAFCAGCLGCGNNMKAMSCDAEISPDEASVFEIMDR